jgi:hypothetical protein
MYRRTHTRPSAWRSAYAIHRDEARWCGVLTKAIRRVGGAPSAKTGAFYDKALAIPDLTDRLAFLNRGQGWVVRKLKALLPTIRDETVHADLAAVLASHERNIDLVAAKLGCAKSKNPLSRARTGMPRPRRGHRLRPGRDRAQRSISSGGRECPSYSERRLSRDVMPVGFRRTPPRRP